MLKWNCDCKIFYQILKCRYETMKMEFNLIIETIWVDNVLAEKGL